MFSDFRKSLNSIFHDRVTSPFWGTLITSWLVWNWKIIVLLMFINENKLPINKNTGLTCTKIEYILNNYSQTYNLIWGPLISSIIIITVIPFLVNASYWVTLKFKKWRIDQRNEIEMRQVLTIEQSLQLRTELKEQEKKFHEIVEDKNALIDNQGKSIVDLNKDSLEKAVLLDQYKNQIDSQQKILTQKEEENRNYFEKVRNLEDTIQNQNNIFSQAKGELKNSETIIQRNELDNEKLRTQHEKLRTENTDLKIKLQKLESLDEKYALDNAIETLINKVMSQTDLRNGFDTILLYIQQYKGRFANTNISPQHIAFFEGNSLIEQLNGQYSFTTKGKEFLKQYSEKVNS